MFSPSVGDFMCPRNSETKKHNQNTTTFRYRSYKLHWDKIGDQDNPFCVICVLGYFTHKLLKVKEKTALYDFQGFDEMERAQGSSNQILFQKPELRFKLVCN